jgi:predicted GIY-YIG superfamily endonuclease
MTYTLYILRNSKNKLYIGQTSNLDERLARHKSGQGARFIKDNDQSFSLVYTEIFSTQIAAMKREKQLKGWTRAKKEALIANDIALLKRL